MKKWWGVLSFLILVGWVHAEISVKSFRKLETDMTARIDAAKKDQNGDVCAIIKVVTTQSGFVWEPDGLGIVSAVPKTGEYWLYVPYGAKRLTIKHPQLGILRDYMYSIPIEKACVYELELVTGRVETTVVEEIASQWLVITPTPASSNIYLNDAFVMQGIYQSKLKSGIYTYRVEAPMYHTQAGKLEIKDAKTVLSVELKPNFGYISVSSKPEDGAQVVIDGKILNNKTPCISEALKSGEYTVQVIKDMYQPVVQKITVSDNQTTTVNFNLQPNFAELMINAPTDAKLIINNQQKAIGSWKGRLKAGVYTLEAQMDKHRTAKQDVELIAGDVKSISLFPTPIYGGVDVVSKPIDATITINGKEYGTTPNTVAKLLIGTYEVKLSKSGYGSTSRTITIEEGKIAEVNEALATGCTVNITTTSTGADLYIDDVAVGKTPYQGSISFGVHNITARQGDKRADKAISLTAGSGKASFVLSFGPPAYTETVNGVSFQMVPVDGGTFTMGSESGGSDQKPTHRVTLSNYFMSKTEVTQALWKAVMGSNPSHFKGDDLPLENVSWDECQEFIGRLNKLTSKTYRLPTEAQWEYAACGGNRSKGYQYAGSNNIDAVAWYDGNSSSQTHSVASKSSNELGLYDMSGNVSEWCSDWYDSYSADSQTNPQGSSSGSNHVSHGGGWISDASYCRSAYRFGRNPNFRFNFLGLRLSSSSK